MSADTARAFVDANVIVYAYDASAGRKKVIAEQLLGDLWATGSGWISVQVLQEFFVTITRKVPVPLTLVEATERVRELTAWDVFAPSADDVLAAIELHRTAGLSFWDALIVHAAAESGCEVLWTEDLADRHVIRGVRVQNPFAGEDDQRGKRRPARGR